jgi:predicted ester cyclase
MMTGAQANKATYLRLVEASNSGDKALILKCLDEIIDRDVLLHTTPEGPEATGPEAVKQIMMMFHDVFPDIHVTADDIIAEGDKLVARQTISGTHRGEYMGIAPTGKSVRYSEIFIYRFADGRVIEAWGFVDVLSLMKQLGKTAA